METQVQWSCPEKFLFKAAWQVAAGNGSIEASAEQRRELGVPEATYPYLNLVPVSPWEPLETCTEVKDSVVPEIPVKKDDEGFSPGGDAAQSPRKVAKKAESGGIPSRFFSGLPPSSAWPATQHDQGGSSSRMSDPNFVVAAATAYAVLKTKERGASVDHDLLNNPKILALLANKGFHPGDFSRTTVGEGVGKGSGELGRTLSNTSVGSSVLTLPVPTRSKTTVPSPEATNIQGWNMSNHFGNSRFFMSSRAEENFCGGAELQGSVPVGGSRCQLLPNRQDAHKDIIHQHRMERSRNEGLSRGLTELDSIGYTKPLSAPRTPTIGPFSQLGPGGELGSTFSHSRGEGFVHARFGGEKLQSRFQKPCKYFNTPKGCRRGSSCFFLHTAASEQHFIEQPQTDCFPFQTAKGQNFWAPDRD